MNSITQSLHESILNPLIWISCSTTNLKMFSWIQIRWLKRLLRNTTVHYDAGCRCQKKERFVHEGMRMVSNNTLNMWHSVDWFILHAMKYTKKTFSTPLHHLHQPGLLKQGRLDPWVHAVCAEFWCFHLWTSGCFSSVNHLLWWVSERCSLSFPFLEDRSGSWRSRQVL